MKTYPSIAREIRKGVQIYAFDKLDGSNIRAEWSRKRGFYKFGARNRLVGQDEDHLGKSEGLVRSKYADDLERIFRKQRWDRVIAFFEFHGPGSFAGLHEASDEHTVTLIDINPHKKGILEPKVFLDIFGELDHAKFLYRGNANHDLQESVQNGTLEGMTFEGIVCKGKYVSPGLPLMFKIKNQAWITQLKERCGDNEALFQQLL